MKSGSTKKSGAHHKRPQQVRIIGGQWKRSALPVADVEGLRPTPDRVRETVFNWIGHLIGGDWHGATCLDLFAGTGALGFEAASRGAANTILVESSPAAIRQLEETKEKLHAQQVTVVRGDALGITQRMAANGQRFDMVFLDPPYSLDLLPRLFPICETVLKENGLLYAESSTPLDQSEGGEILEWLQGWEIVRADRAGSVFYYLLKTAK